MLNLSAAQIQNAIRAMMSGDDYATGGNLSVNGLLWEAEVGTFGEAILTVHFAQKNAKAVSLYAGQSASSDLDRARFVKAVSLATGCAANLRDSIQALSVI